MRELPRNVKTGPSRIHLCAADDMGDTFDWDESYRVTPPPVAVSYDDLRPSSENSESGDGRRSRYAIWTAVILGVVLALGANWVRMPPQKQRTVALRAWVSDLSRLQPQSFLKEPPVSLDDFSRQRRADARLSHDGYASIPGGVLYTPSSFTSPDGAYDLLLHFHGNVKVIVESAVAAKLNAAVAVVNLGVGSARYEDFYATPGMYEKLLGHIQAGMKRRGLENPRLRRIGLSAWSAGYGAISTILTQRRGLDPLDAILVLDGIHAGYEEGRPGVLMLSRLAPFAEAALAAASGELLFSITYSEIDPPGYAGSRATAEYLLEVSKEQGQVVVGQPSTPAYLRLESMKGAVSKEDACRLEPLAEHQVGDFRTRGYRGNTRGHHMAHLFQMGSTVLPELTQRWNSYAGYSGRADAIQAGRVRMRARSGHRLQAK